ncbi:MAG: cyclic nucleotide-binding domain-containing [Lasallia pustulata]|uniref:Cyclic nucleotide-binding domain-containing n=1 Tax=Lasallia pustulata TaxID=136370 RepID=A0A5M8Q1W2_9LECA|nr:MAG: cyclic nucleotide-binding domain-containing [Lasallia pustulata]
MRRHHRSAGGTAFARQASTTPVPDSVSLIRTFNSETNPSRPIRPSPLTASPIHGMPLDMLDRIRSFPLFRSAPDSFLVAIGTHLRPQLHSAHDYILTEGDDAKAMYWLVRGAVAVTSRDGESTYAELKQGAFFGEIGILMDIPRTATIIARTRCLLVVLTKEDLKKELPRFPEVERAIREEAQERLSILERKKKEKIAANREDASNLVGRGEKRARDGEDGDILMPDSNGGSSNGSTNNKKRKSPSPGLIEAAASSALGSGLVNVRQLLKELPLFSSLPPEILHFLGLNAQPRTYPPFTVIIQQGSFGREVFFIVRGEVEVIDEKFSGHDQQSMPNGAGRSVKRGVQVKARLKQGQYFGEVASLFLAPRRTATVRSVTEVECLMITGDILAEFWTRCPLTIKQQVEKIAKERLRATSDGDVIMADAADFTPPIDELAIVDRSPNVSSRLGSRKKSVPKVTFSYNKPASTHKPSRLEDRPIIEPCDPDPFLNLDLDNIRSRSRRGSLAPPPPDVAQPNGPEHGDKRPSSPTSLVATAASSKLKHVTTPPDLQNILKRPRTIQRSPSQYNRGPLPDNVLVSIFAHLELHQIMCLRLVSLHWSRLLKESPELLPTLNLAMYNRKVTDDILMKIICPFVGARPRVVDISNCFHITDEGFSTLASTCGTNVTCWKMKSVWDITAQAVLEMANKAKRLEEVDLSNCRKVSDNLLARVIGWVVQSSPPNSSHSNLNGRQVAARSVGAPVPPQPPPGTVFGCPKLRKLTLSYCKHVTDRSMAHLACHAASRLEEIDLTRCTTITDQGFQHWGQFQFPMLKKLCLADCTYLTDNAIVYLTNAAKGLQDLDLSFCCALSDTATEVLALGCPHLTHLNLSFCGSAVSDSSLRSIGLHLLELRQLSVRGCVRVTGVGVEAVVDGCHKLEAFDVSQCKNLSKWLENGSVQKFTKRVRFQTVAGKSKRAR